MNALSCSGEHVQTVCGAIDPARVGVTSAHEHLSIDGSYFPTPPRTDRQRRLHDHPITIELLGDARRDPAVFKSVLPLKDEDMVIDELREFVEEGGMTVIELTSCGLRPDPLAVRRISLGSGVNVVMGCGHYLADSVPHLREFASPDDLAMELVREIRSGLAGTDVLPGVIGEIGVGCPVEELELFSLTAAATAQIETGLPLFVHVDPGTDPVPVVERVLGLGVDPQRLVACHMESQRDVSRVKVVAAMGVIVSFDTFGMEMHFDSFGYASSASDAQRVERLLDVLAAGHAESVLLGQDVCMKLQLRRFGGYGYAHLLRHIIPELRFKGVSEVAIETMLVANPTRVLTLAARRDV